MTLIIHSMQLRSKRHSAKKNVLLGTHKTTVICVCMERTCWGPSFPLLLHIQLTVSEYQLRCININDK